MKTTKQILQEAYDLIGDKKRWTQNAYAKDEYGTTVDARSEQAVCWCAGGAITKAGDDFGNKAFYFLQGFCSDRYNMGIAYVNDQLGYAAIRRMFRKAIKAA